MIPGTTLLAVVPPRRYMSHRGHTQDGNLSYFHDQDEAEAFRSEADSQLHHHPSSQRQLSLDCVEAVRTEVCMLVWFSCSLTMCVVVLGVGYWNACTLLNGCTLLECVYLIGTRGLYWNSCTLVECVYLIGMRVPFWNAYTRGVCPSYL